jgi:hypothetical protein
MTYGVFGRNGDNIEARDASESDLHDNFVLYSLAFTASLLSINESSSSFQHDYSCYVRAVIASEIAQVERTTSSWSYALCCDERAVAFRHMGGHCSLSACGMYLELEPCRCLISLEAISR